MAEFVLKNSIFEFNSKAYQQKSGTPIAAKFTPPYACIYMGQLNKFLEMQSKEPPTWSRYIDDIFFYLDSWWTGTRKIFEGFKKFYP